MTFKAFLRQTSQEIDLEIERFFHSNTYFSPLPQSTSLWKAFHEANKNGKRVRGTLVKLGYMLATDGRSDPALNTIALAYELFETAILAHDDIIDNSEKRRGQKSLFVTLGGDHYGISQSICLGDMGFFLAYQLISQSDFPARVKNEALTYFSKNIIYTIHGEMLDVSYAQQKEPPTEKAILEMYRLKTAYYTIVSPLSLGMILAGAKKKLLHSVKQFGENAGIVYQIEDDIADIFGNPEGIKKNIGGDIKEGKNTLLFAAAYKRSTPSQRKILQKLYGKPEIYKEDIQTIRNVFAETGTVDYVTDCAQQYNTVAKNMIAQITGDVTMQEMLKDLLYFVMKKEIKKDEA